MVLSKRYISLICFVAVSCSWGTVQRDTKLISDQGIKGLIEFDMTPSDLSQKQIVFTKKTLQYRRPGQEIYALKDLDIEFETHHDTIIRIWFFSIEKDGYKLLMPKDGTKWVLNNIRGEDIVEKFGAVKKYLDRNSPKGINEARWVKYSPFGIKMNTINYPGLPFHFGLNWDDTLSYVTVSKVE